MAAARQRQSNAMLYTVITFVGLFLLAAILAVVFYLKSEEWRNQYVKYQDEIGDLVNAKELRSAKTIVGEKERRNSYFGQLLAYFDNIYKMTTGLDPQETSVEVKSSELRAKYDDFLVAANARMGFGDDPNGPGTFRIIEAYANKLDQKQLIIDQMREQLDDLNDEYDTVRTASMEKEQELLLQIRSEQEKADGVQKSYAQLRDLMDKKTTEQVQMLMDQRDEAIEEKSQKQQELLATLSQLTITQNRMKNALARLEVIKPGPKKDMAAYKADGKIISTETSADVVFLDIGSDDKVYPGLTFSVYNRGTPIPTDGKGKAEIEIFDVAKNTSIARIVKSSRKNPIIEDDIIVNLIWDSKAENSFAIAGEFDFDGNGTIDADGTKKIASLIENWGGKVDKAVTIDTDFVVLGIPPRILAKPSLDTIESDPMAMDKYEDSLKASEFYQEAKVQAKDLYVPIFGFKRFLNFIGYEAIATGTNTK